MEALYVFLHEIKAGLARIRQRSVVHALFSSLV